MHNTTIMITLFALALVTWGGLLLFMNQQVPDTANRVLFLGIWGIAVSLTMSPVAFATAARLTHRSQRRQDLNQALRRGLILGVVSALLMGLRFMRLLTPTMAFTLLMLGVALEVLLSLRGR